MKNLIVAFAIFGYANSVSAEIIDFQNALQFPQAALSTVTPVTVGNFVISSPSANAEVSNDLSIDLPGGVAPVSRGVFANSESAMTFSITRFGGGLFNLLGFDWGFDSDGATSNVVNNSTVVGTGGGGPEVFQVANSALGDTTGFTTFSPTVGFNGAGISQLDFFFSDSTFANPGRFGFDDIELETVGASAAVPEPSSFAMLFAGGVGVVVAGRRRRKNAA
jgi:hypothetical protein